MLRGYHQTSALPLLVVMNVNDQNSSTPLEITLKHLTIPLITAILMQEAVYCITLTVQQL